MNTIDLRQKDNDELTAIEAELREELFRLKMQHYTGQLDKVSRLKETRRSIARIATIRNQRAQEASAEQGA